MALEVSPLKPTLSASDSFIPGSSDSSKITNPFGAKVSLITELNKKIFSNPDISCIFENKRGFFHYDTVYDHIIDRVITSVQHIVDLQEFITTPIGEDAKLISCQPHELITYQFYHEQALSFLKRNLIDIKKALNAVKNREKDRKKSLNGLHHELIYIVNQLGRIKLAKSKIPILEHHKMELNEVGLKIDESLGQKDIGLRDQHRIIESSYQSCRSFVVIGKNLEDTSCRAVVCSDLFSETKFVFIKDESDNSILGARALAKFYDSYIHILSVHLAYFTQAISSYVHLKEATIEIIKDVDLLIEKLSDQGDENFYHDECHQNRQSDLSSSQLLVQERVPFVVSAGPDHQNGHGTKEQSHSESSGVSQSRQEEVGVDKCDDSRDEKNECAEDEFFSPFSRNF